MVRSPANLQMTLKTAQTLFQRWNFSSQSSKHADKAMELIRDLPKGPLDVYRKKASFNWKSMKLHLEGEEGVEYQNKLWDIMEKEPAFHKPNHQLSLDELRRRCQTQMLVLKKYDIDPMMDNDDFNLIFYCDSSMAVKLGISSGLVPSTLMSLGSERHSEIIEGVQDNILSGCFALTEIAHGTNAKGMRTTATYDPSSESFIIHSPGFEDAKCWVGGLGKTATHAITYAQLITPDGTNHGLHLFVVPIRDPKSYLPYPGVTVGDMGEKVGLNGVDNGWVQFNNYRIPRVNLLNKTADVTPDGKYVTAIKDQNKRFGTSLGALSGGRVTITSICTMYASMAMVIAMRYCAARKQFGPSPGEEWPVIEYQAQQGRIVPHLAAVYAMRIVSKMLFRQFRQFLTELHGSGDKDLAAVKGMELHALSSALKPLCAWTSRDVIQDCRESCGGHGYLKESRLGDIRSDNDANCTYEGESNVLIQQTSNWLLNQWSKVINGKQIDSPLGSAAFINDAQSILRLKFNIKTVDETMKPENLLTILQWLSCYYLQKTYNKVQDLRREGNSDFVVRNDSQLFFAKTLTLVYGEQIIVQYFMRRINDSDWDESERVVLRKLCSLYAASCIERRLGDLYAGGFATASCQIDNLIREGIIRLCRELVDEAVPLVDVLAAPDFVMRSILGYADGEIYKHIEDSFKQPENVERPTWWKEILTSKL